MSVQLDALADEVFAAAAAHVRAGARATRRPFGEVISNPEYPDLAFANVIQDLVAPDWTVEDLERAVEQELSTARRVRIRSRDARTVAALGPRLATAGYPGEARVGMMQVAIPARQQPPHLSVRLVDDGSTWAAFDELNRVDALEHGWDQATTHQLVDLCHWRAANTSHHYYVASEPGRVVAYVGVYQAGTTAYVHSLFTHPAARGKGVGASLMLAVSDRGHAMGCQRVTLECARDSRLPAYYAGLGFRTVGEEWVWTKP